jgi:hypothetical protein
MSLPGSIFVRVDTMDPVAIVLFMRTGIFRLSSVSQMKISPLFMKTLSYLGKVLTLIVANSPAGSVPYLISMVAVPAVTLSDQLIS